MPRARGLILNPDAFDYALSVVGVPAATVAEQAGISTATLSGLRNPLTASAIERGKCQPAASPAVAQALAAALRTPLGALFPEITRRFSSTVDTVESEAVAV